MQCAQDAHSKVCGRASYLSSAWLLTSFFPWSLDVIVPDYFHSLPKASELGRGASNLQLYSVGKTVMIINDCAPSPQNAPGAINPEWVSTATVFRGLSGSFSAPPALIRPSYLPPFLIPLTIPTDCLLTGRTKECHSLPTTLFYSNFHLVAPLEPTPWIMFLGATLIPTYLLLPLLMLWI